MNTLDRALNVAATITAFGILAVVGFVVMVGAIMKAVS